MRDRARVAVLLILLTAALPAPGAAAPAAPEPPAPLMDVVVEGRLVSLEVGRVPIADVLRVIAERIGAELTIHGQPGMAVPLRLTRVPVDRAIRQLLERSGDYGVTLVYDRPGTGAALPVEILVVAPSAARARGRPPSGGDVRTRLGHVWALARAQTPVAARDLAQSLAGDPEPTVRRAAAAALARFEGPEPRAALLRALSADDDVVVRRTAVRALARRADPEAERALEHAVRSDPDPSVRAAAASVLARWRRSRVPGD